MFAVFPCTDTQNKLQEGEGTRDHSKMVGGERYWQKGECPFDEELARCSARAVQPC